MFVEKDKVIQVNNFSKSFGPKEVVKDLSFDVHKGEIFALLGANGSGKTTTIRCLLNILRPSAGSLLIKGRPYGPDIAYILGYLPEERGLYVTATVLETMTYFGQLKGLSPVKARQWSLDYLGRVELGDKASEKIIKLSSGQQQKIQLGITIINNPQLLILDEPTKGLDPVNRSLLMEILEQLNGQGSTIIFITHQMDEVEKLADRLVMIKDGHRVLYGGVNEVKKSYGGRRIQLGFSGKLPKNDDLFTTTITEASYAELTLAASVAPNDILAFLLKSKLSVNRFAVAAPSLQEIFVMISKDHEK